MLNCNKTNTSSQIVIVIQESKKFAISCGWFLTVCGSPAFIYANFRVVALAATLSTELWMCVCATSRELIKCGPKRGLQPLKSEPEQSPHKIRGGSMGIFKANLKPHPLLVTKGRERTKGSRMLRSQRHVAHITCRRRHCSRCSCIQMQLESERQEFSVAVEAFLWRQCATLRLLHSRQETPKLCHDF